MNPKDSAGAWQHRAGGAFIDGASDSRTVAAYKPGSSGGAQLRVREPSSIIHLDAFCAVRA